MPAGAVKTKRDEAAWERAKAKTRKQYPNIKEGTPRFYRIVMTIYKNMRGKAAKPKSILEKALRS